jgi:quercetin dioxygenase-like cupin family protein
MIDSEPRIVRPHDGKAGFLGSIGARFMIGGDETSERFALVEHPLGPHALAAPLHRHAHEDEYSFVLEGRIGALLGDDAVYGEAGDLIFKPRDQWHTFWNAGDEPARVLELISPAGFERFFEEIADLDDAAKLDPQVLGEICPRYGLEVDPTSVPGLIERFGVRFPGDPVSAEKETR